MKLTQSFVCAFAFFSASIFALPTLATQCGAAPQPPALLAQSQITLTELQTLQAQMSVYKAGVTAYVDCEDDGVGALTVDTAGMTEEFIQSEAFLETTQYQTYQSQVDVINARVDAALSARMTHTNQYNAHVVSAAPDIAPEPE